MVLLILFFFFFSFCPTPFAIAFYSTFIVFHRETKQLPDEVLLCVEEADCPCCSNCFKVSGKLGKVQVNFYLHLDLIGIPTHTQWKHSSGVFFNNQKYLSGDFRMVDLLMKPIHNFTFV